MADTRKENTIELTPASVASCPRVTAPIAKIMTRARELFEDKGFHYEDGSPGYRLVFCPTITYARLLPVSDLRS